jgi:Secretion system C-terminal sorting domain
MKPIFTLVIYILLLIIALPNAFAQVYFEALSGPTGVPSVVNVRSDANNNLFVSAKQAIYRSTDNGNNWSECMNGMIKDGYSYNFMLSPTGQFYAKKGVFNTNMGLYQYNEIANNWELRNNDFAEYSIDNQGNIWAIRPLQELNYFYISTDGGTNFQNVPSNLTTQGYFDMVATYNNEHNLIVISGATGRTLVHFNRNGNTQVVLNGDAFLFLGYSPITGTAFETGYGHCNRSTDGGLTWQNMNIDASIPNTPFIKSIIFGADSTIWAYSGLKMYKSIDDGFTWTTAFSLPTLSGDYYLPNSNTWFLRENCGLQFARSTDVGITWDDLSTKFLFPDVLDIITDEDGNQYVKTCRKKSYQKSTDLGDSWNEYIIDANNTPKNVSSMAVNKDGVILAIGDDDKLYRSLNNGISWTNLTNVNQLNNDFIQVYCDYTGNFYYCTAYQTLKTTDLGNNWSALNILISGENQFSFHNNGDIVSLENNIFATYYSASEDSTFEITNVTNTNPNGFIFPNFCKFSPSGTMFLSALSLQTVQNQLFRIENINGTWQEIPFFEEQEISHIAFNKLGVVFVISNDTIYQSHDDGTNWSIYCQLPKPYPNIFSCTADNYLYLGYSGDVIYRSNIPTTEAHYILGNSWLDLNNNCQKDPTENSLPYTKVKATGDNDYIGFVRPDGNYLVNAPTGSYQVNIVPPNPLYAPCNADATVVLDATHDSVSVNMPLRIVAFCPYLSVNLSTPFLRRCFENTYTIQYKNEGTAAAQNAYIEVTLDSLLEFIGASLPVFSQNGLVYTFQVGNLDVNQSGSFWLKTKVSCLAELGQEHCISASIFPDAPCGTPMANRATTQECRENIGAFDPNDKKAFVDGKPDPSNILQNKEIEYFIQFQNTGTDTAFRVVVEDRISGLLDLSTLTPLVSSHPFSIEIKDQRTIRFVFDNIMLPDSNINEAASHGFIKFRIAQKPDLQNGEVIANLADIFFDFNAPVRTNTSNMVVGITNTYTPSPNYQILAYPNPFNDQISFEINTKQTINTPMTLSIVDVLGKQILREKFIGTSHNVVVSDLQTGIYFYKIENGGVVIGAGKLMKM